MFWNLTFYLLWTIYFIDWIVIPFMMNKYTELNLILFCNIMQQCRINVWLDNTLTLAINIMGEAPQPPPPHPPQFYID